MFTRPDQLQRKGGPEERLSFLQKLKEEYLTTKSLEAKQQVLANLANFGYDPINYSFIKQLHIVDLFLNELRTNAEREKLCASAVGGLCNLSNDPEIAFYITTENTIRNLTTLLHHHNKDIILNSVATLYYLARHEASGHLISTPAIFNKLLSFRAANDPRLANIAAVFLHDIWDAKPTRHLESAEVSSQPTPAQDCGDIPLPRESPP